MRESDRSWSPETFDRIYAADADPWKFTTSRYERKKNAATLAALGDRRFAALEIGCSIGVSTRLLAWRCEALLAVDVAEAALADARRRCAGLPGVRIKRRQVPGE
ncbi:MAG TPA: SAM-dependent methyltransferase [Acetobacteraceae bacterium]|nr:SAM-dependent methyltransferase [Acetobacteraceae bacterium]